MAAGFPLEMEGLTPEWLTETLRAGGHLREARVSGVCAAPLGAGFGLLGALARLELEYDREEPGAPRTLIAKLPAPAEPVREVARQYRVYEREARFYRDVAPAMAVNIPGIYFVGLDEETGDATLLLEDLAGARLGDQLDPPGPEAVNEIVDELAKLHAAWWGAGESEALAWVPFLAEPPWTFTPESFRGWWPTFLENFGHLATPELQAVAELMKQALPAVLERLSRPPVTLLHADYRLDDMFFGAQPGQPPVTIIDWQLASRGRGATDLAYFMSQSVPPAQRRATEMDVIRRYHARLEELGVQDYSFAECYEDYRLATLFCIIYPVSAGGGTLDLANDRGLALATAMAERCFAAIVELESAKLIAG